MSMSDQKEKTVPISLQAVLQKAVHQFKEAGIEKPRLEAEVLLTYFLDIDRLELYMQWEQNLSESRVHEFQSLVSRRVHREPLAYITGKREFWSLDFIVTPRVLIPRPETEFLVEAVLTCVSQPATIIDVGTGSGIIAVCLARERPQFRIYALDLCEGALQVARLNAISHKVINQITFLRADFLSCVAPHSIDCLVANPPYIPTREIFTLSPEIYNFEPHLALDGGRDGLQYSQRIIRDACRILKTGGWLILEIGYGQKDSLLKEVQEQGLRVQKVISDYAGLDRVIVSKK